MYYEFLNMQIYTNFLTFFYVFWTFQKEKYTFFQKCSKIGLVAKKLIITFGGVRTQSDKNHFF